MIYVDNILLYYQHIISILSIYYKYIINAYNIYIYNIIWLYIKQFQVFHTDMLPMLHTISTEFLADSPSPERCESHKTPLPRVPLRPQLLQSQGTQHPERLVWVGWRENQQGRIAQNGSKLISPGKHLAIFFELGTDEHHQKKGRSSHTTPIWFWRTCTCGFTSNALQICQPNHWWSSTTSLHTVLKVPLAIVVDIGLCRVLFNLFEWQSKFPV